MSGLTDWEEHRRHCTANTCCLDAVADREQVTADAVLDRLAADWHLLKDHHPVGAYLEVGQLDGDCKCGRGDWPCPTVRAAALDAAPSQPEECERCYGTGEIEVEIDGGDNTRPEDCPECHGKGTLPAAEQEDQP